MKTSLMPCPFCGCQPKLRIKRDSWGKTGYVIECRAARCVACPETTPCDSKGKARDKAALIEAWNARPKP